MNDDKVLPIDGGEASEDAELANRVARHYQATPGSSAAMAARCVGHVLQQAASTNTARIASKPRHWFIGAAAAAAVLVATLTMRNSGPQDAPSATDSDRVASATVVDHGSAIQFELRLPPGAAKVAVVGDFNGWDTSATPMAQLNSNGTWSAKVTLLPGRHIYAYIVNGERWMVDPLAPQVSDNDFGPANAVVLEGGAK